MIGIGLMNPLSKAAVHNTNTLSQDEDTLEAKTPNVPQTNRTEIA